MFRITALLGTFRDFGRGDNLTRTLQSDTTQVTTQIDFDQEIHTTITERRSHLSELLQKSANQTAGTRLMNNSIIEDLRKNYPEPEIINMLKEIICDSQEDKWTRVEAVYCLGDCICTRDAIIALNECIDRTEGDYFIRHFIALNLRLPGIKGILEVYDCLEKLRDDPDGDVSRVARNVESIVDQLLPSSLGFKQGTPRSVLRTAAPWIVKSAA